MALAMENNGRERVRNSEKNSYKEIGVALLAEHNSPCQMHGESNCLSPGNQEAEPPCAQRPSYNFWVQQKYKPGPPTWLGEYLSSGEIELSLLNFLLN